MPSINRGGHVLLTEAVMKIASENLLTKAVVYNVTASVNRSIFIGGHIINNRLCK
jgi:hypothetical protein